MINDQLGQVPVVVWFNPATETGAAYDRRLDGRLLTFAADEADPTFFRDEETGSSWQGLSGAAVSGELRGARLDPLPATPAFEFGWRDYFPDDAAIEATRGIGGLRQNRSPD